MRESVSESVSESSQPRPTCVRVCCVVRVLLCLLLDAGELAWLCLFVCWSRTRRSAQPSECGGVMGLVTDFEDASVRVVVPRGYRNLCVWSGWRGRVRVRPASGGVSVFCLFVSRFRGSSIASVAFSSLLFFLSPTFFSL
mgnify:CR=1 FL=1